MRLISRRTSGVALVVTLAIVALLTVVILAFFSQATANRQIEASRSHRSEADTLARSSGDYIVARFLQEVANPSYSRSLSSNGSIVYQPLTNANAVPQTLISASIPASNANFSNLVRQSVADSNADPNASADNSASPSLDGRIVSTTRWNMPVLLGGSGFSDVSQLPKWIYVNNSNGVNKNLSSSTIGRFAYNVYQVDGLLNINAAGIPSVASSEVALFKGSSAGADLTQLGAAQADIDKLVKFRNPNVQSSASDYLNCVNALSAAGFLSPIVTGVNGQFTNVFFNSRQDLQRYATVQAPALAKLLPYLTTFSRTKNAPSWGPSADSASSAYQYLTNANAAGTSNRFLPNVRVGNADVTVTHYLDDGTVDPQTHLLAANSPLLQQRFSLAKLAWITSNGPASSISAAAIQSCFGLMWDSANFRWNYVGASGSSLQPTLETLDQVALEKREPNFFELLKAGILSGSIGQNPGTYPVHGAGLGGTLIGFQGADGQYFPDRYGITDRHVVQIGASLIDQSRADNYPTAIRFKAFTMADSFEDDLYNVVFGVKDLPYLSQIDTVVWQIAANSANGWLQPELWNPHASEVQPPTATPTLFRIRAYGESHTTVEQWCTIPTGLTDNHRTTIKGIPVSYPGNYSASDSKCLYFSAAAADFRNNPQPVPVSLLGSGNDPANYVQTTWNGPREVVGFHTGSVPFNYTYCPLKSGYLANSAFSIWTHIDFDTPMTFILDYKAVDGTWRPYNYISRLERNYPYRRGFYFDSTGNVPTFQADASGNYNNWDYTKVRAGSPMGDASCARVDPRSDRFSLSMGYISTSTTPSFLTSNSFQPSASVTNPTFDSWPGGSTATNVTFVYPTSASTVKSLYSFAVNTTTTTSGYTDADGVQRPGDAWKQDISSGDGCVFFSGGSVLPRRPVVLNHPFLSVGDMGYTFRDLPFKSLDFSSTLGADSALLDIFALQDEPLVIAGSFNVNKAPAPVLQAIFFGGEKNRTVSADTISSADATSLATGLVKNLAASPVFGVADSVARLSTVIDVSSLAGTDQKNKSYREAALRALASTTGCRTWNFLIDVIAQSGRGNPRGRTGFLVQGERRYWVHVGIDRYTGEIVDQVLEPIYE